MKTKIFMTWLAFLLGTLTTLHAQKHIVVIGEVKNIEEGTVFNLEETSGTGATRLFRKDEPEDNGKVINGRFILSPASISLSGIYFIIGDTCSISLMDMG